MKNASAASIANIRELFAGALPVLSDQKLVFGRLLKSIDHCEKFGSSAWSVTLLDTGFRLNVGQVEAMTCSFQFWDTATALEAGLNGEVTFVGLRLLLAEVDQLTLIDTSDDVATVDAMNYGSVGVPHWCYHGSFIASATEVPDVSRVAVEQHLEKMAVGHGKFLERACSTPTGKLRQRSNFARHNCEGLYAYGKSLIEAA